VRFHLDFVPYELTLPYFVGRSQSKLGPTFVSRIAGVLGAQKWLLSLDQWKE